MSLFRRFTNIFTSIKKFDLNVDKLSSFREISERGYDNIADSLAKTVEIDDWRKKKAAKLDLDKEDDRVRKDYLKKYKLKSEDRITEIYKGQLKGSNEKIPKGFDSTDISVYESNKGGIVVLMALENSETGEMKFYIGCDGKGDRFFKSVNGMSVDTFASLNRVDKSKTYTNKTVSKFKNKEEIPEPTNDTKSKDEDLYYYELVDKVKNEIRDTKNPNWFGFIKIDKEQYDLVMNRLKMFQKKIIPMKTKNLGNIFRVVLNEDENIYFLNLSKGNKPEYYIIYESPENDTSPLDSTIFKGFDLDNHEDVHWIKSLDIEELPSF